MDRAHPVDRRLEVAVQASLAWYEDVFRTHGIPTRLDDGLWSALGEPPRWHSAAKTLRPGVPAAKVLQSVDAFDSCSVADSYGTLDLAGHGFRQLFRAAWLHRPPMPGAAGTWPEGWAVVSGEDDLASWNTAQDTTGVLLPALLRHPAFTFLVRRSAGQMVAGSVLHRVDGAVDLSNLWAAGADADELPSMLDCTETLFPGLPVVGYCRDDALATFTDVGFRAVGAQVVWVREG